MKNVMIALVLLCSFSMAAQGGPPEKNGTERPQTNLSAEQQASLKSKRMTLSLDLSTEQQQRVEKILTDHIHSRRAVQARGEAMRAAGVMPDQQQRFEHINARLEEQIALQNEIKGILSDEQYGIWKKVNLARHRGKKHPAVIR
ncbi:hypothetical protein [Robiginitalea sp. IMCC43444]|uniref:hypothetical protein n=1 Tax=Robiginitalea sp. IMCC43444 TaxID=3459121 RepID=UPI0040419945